MSVWGWIAFGLGVANVVVWTFVVVAARRLYRQVRPMVEPYLQMFAAPAIIDAAAGTGGIGESADSSPAATPDRCEYEDHEWSTERVGPRLSNHYCLRCGYVEPLPGI